MVILCQKKIHGDGGQWPFFKRKKRDARRLEKQRNHLRVSSEIANLTKCRQERGALKGRGGEPQQNGRRIQSSVHKGASEVSFSFTENIKKKNPKGGKGKTGDIKTILGWITLSGK